MASKQEIKTDHDFFTQMLDLIPTNFYFDTESKKLLREESEDESEEEAVNHLQKTKDAPNRASKRSGEELSMKAKWKRAKFDPSQNVTVSQMTQELANKQAAAQKETQVKQKLKVLSATPDDSVPDLRAKLKNKIEMMKAKRHALDRREEFQKRRLKRNELKAKKKMRQKHEKQERATNGPVTTKAKPAQPSKPIYNKEGKMVFSKFDFCERKEVKSEKKNFKALLEKAQKNKEKMEALKETDASAATNLKQKQQWQNVLQKAEGVAVKDDPELLKKALKKKEKKKEKSKKQWKERESKVEEKMKDKQVKRASNIKKKKEGRINKKIAKAKKKGRIIPGF